MIGLFVFDGPLYKDNEGKYCSLVLTNDMFNRYFSVVEKLFVIVRTFALPDYMSDKKMKRLNTEKMEIIEITNILSLKGILLERNKIKKIISSVLDRTDMVFARMPSVLSYLTCEMCVKTKKPYLVEVGGCAWDSYWNHSIIGKIVAPAMFFYEKRYVEKARYATYVTGVFLQKRYPNNNITADCSNVYIVDFDPGVLKKRVEKINSQQGNRIVFGQMVGSIDVWYKGEQFFIKSINDLKKMGINPVFQIVGPGEGVYLKKIIKKYRVEDNVTFLGAMQKEEKFEWLQSIDIYVQPSLQEGLPRAVIEAMSVGCPVIGSDIAGIPELIDKRCLFNPRKNAEIVDAVCKLLSNEKMIKQAKKNYYEAKNYLPEILEEKRQQIFKKYYDFICDLSV